MPRRQVFEGIKIAQFCWGAVGTQVARELALHGATMIRVESHRTPDAIRLASPFKDGKPGVNRGPLSTTFQTNGLNMSLDLSKPAGLEVAHKLIRWADIMAESFTPGTLVKFGLDYESVRKIKPDIIYYSTCQHGRYGPYAKIGGLGVQGAAGAGFYYITGWPDRDPALLLGAYTDFVSPWFLVVPLIAALLHRRRTGEGMHLDHSQYEAAIPFLAPAILDYTVNGRIAGRTGNRHPAAVPHNAYQCMGNDRWVAIAVRTDEEWQALCHAIGRPELAHDPRYATFLARREREEEIDKVVTEWARHYTAEEAMLIMQAAGVPAGVASTCQDLLEDPQFQHRQRFVVLNHKEIGPMVYRSPAYRLSKTPARLVKAGPCLGEDNEYIYKGILGYSDDEVTEMLADGVITTEYDAPAVKRG